MHKIFFITLFSILFFSYQVLAEITEDMKKGDILTEKNLSIVRPGLGLPPKYYGILLGRTLSRDVSKGTATSWDIID